MYGYPGIYNEASVSLEVEITEPDLSVMEESIEVLRQAGILRWVWLGEGPNSMSSYLCCVWQVANRWISQGKHQ